MGEQLPLTTAMASACAATGNRDSEGNQVFDRTAIALRDALKQIGQATQQAWAGAEPAQALANAVPYLQAFGHTVIAWIWLDVVQSAQGDAPAAVGRRAAARYFFRYELPKIGAWLQVVAQRDPTCAEVPEDAF